jgi:hypothetical protein
MVNDSVLKAISMQTQSHYGALDLPSANIIAGVVEAFAVVGLMPVMVDETEGEGREDNERGRGTVREEEGEAALMDLFNDEEFVTVPDWRLGEKSWWPVREDGVLLTGMYGGGGKRGGEEGRRSEGGERRRVGGRAYSLFPQASCRLPQNLLALSTLLFFRPNPEKKPHGSNSRPPSLLPPPLSPPPPPPSRPSKPEEPTSGGSWVLSTAGT